MAIAPTLDAPPPGAAAAPALQPAPAAPAFLDNTVAPAFLDNTVAPAFLDNTAAPAFPGNAIAPALPDITAAPWSREEALRPAPQPDATPTTEERPATSEARDAIRGALLDSLPVFAGIIPFGIVIGVAIGEAGVNNTAGWAGSFLMFGGSAHLAAVSLLDGGAGLLAVLATVLVINARLLVYSASLGPRFRYQPSWFRWTAPYFLVDQIFALTWARLDTGTSPAWLRTYYLALGLVTGAVWIVAIALGVLAGPVIPQSWELAFATPLMLVALLAPSLVDRPAWIAAAVGAATAVLLIGMPHGLHLLIGTAAGTLAGIAAERIQR